jgi:uncharacterized membrane protein YGL010W
MKTIDQWLNLYARDHKNPTNQIIHKICVPLIMFSVFGLLWSIPRMEFMTGSVFFNWASLFALACLVFYIRLDRIYFILMLMFTALMFTGLFYLSQTAYLLSTSIIIFVLAWIGQFIGHEIEGAKPSFFEDLQFLLIGPLWVLKSIRALF